MTEMVFRVISYYYKIQNKLSIEDIRREKTTLSVEVRKRIAYIMKEINHCESAEIMLYLKISSSTLSSYIRGLYDKIITKELMLEELHIL